MGLALIVGVGDGLSASLARKLFGRGATLALASRRPDRLEALRQETGATVHACDASDPEDVARLFAAVGSPELVVYNPSARVRGPLVDLDPKEVARTLAVTAYGGFLVGQLAARAMLAAGRGTILFTGASASLKGYAQSAPFAMGKFALRGLAQSMARELHPQNIHVAHAVIDGAIRSAARPDTGDGTLDPGAIADAYLALVDQPRNAWSTEIELRPWVERF